MNRSILIVLSAAALLQACQNEPKELTAAASNPEENILPETFSSEPLIGPPATDPPAAASCPIRGHSLAQEEDKDRALVDSFFRLTEVPKQSFTISNLNDTTIVGMKGTIVFIPAGCFRTAASDRPINGEVCFEMKECYDYSEMLAENLNTSNDEFLLESQGMIHIVANAGSEALQLREGKELPVIFNTKEDSNTYDLFYGEKDKDGKLNWKLDNLACEPSPVIFQTEVVESPAEQLFLERFYDFGKEEKIAMLNSSWQTGVSFNERGEVIGKSEGVFDDGKNVLARKHFFEVIDKLRYYVRNDHFPAWGRKYSFTCIDADSAAFLKEQGVDLAAASQWRMGVSSFLNSKQSFYARSMGWLNCDRNFILKPIAAGAAFLMEKIHERREANKERHSAMIELNRTGNDNVDVQLVFSDKKAIVPGRIVGDRCLFAEIPDNEPFYIVATRCTKGEIFLAIQESRLDGKDIKINLAYTTYASPEEVKEEYRKLDKRLD